MRKILSFFLSLTLLSQVLLFSPDSVHGAFNCPVTTSSSSDSRLLNIKVNTAGILPNTEDGNQSKYWVKLDASFIDEYIEGALGEYGYLFSPSHGEINIPNVNSHGILNPPSYFTATFQTKAYNISVQEPKSGGREFCSGSFNAQETTSTSGGTCGIQFLNQKWTVEDDIIIQGTNLGNLNEDRRLTVRRDKANGPERFSQCLKASELSSGKNIGKLEAGTYYPEIYKSCGGVTDLAPQKMCFGPNFLVGKEGGFGPTPGPLASPIPVCKGGFCETALGKIFTDPVNFANNFFGILLSLAGGIAIILIILSGYSLMSSGGNPEKVQAARDQLISAVVGLLFIIFSLSILQIVGVDILNIPGLK